MAILKFEDMVDEDLVRSMNESEFDYLNEKAESLLHYLTRNFYKFHSFDDDFDFRKNAVKNALKSQILYFVETGQTTSEGLNSTPSSVTLGRTTISVNSRYGRIGNDNHKKSLICDEMYFCLENTGLLNRGV